MSQLLHLRPELEDASLVTVLLFTLLILIYRPRWKEWAFWRDLSMTSVLHVLVASVILKSIPIPPHGFPLLVMGIMVLIEGSLIIILLDKRSGE